MRINLVIQLAPVLLAVGILASPYPYDMKKDIAKRETPPTIAPPTTAPPTTAPPTTAPPTTAPPTTAPPTVAPPTTAPPTTAPPTAAPPTAAPPTTAPPTTAPPTTAPPTTAPPTTAPPTVAPPTTVPPTTAPPTTAPPTTAPASPGSKLVGIQLICSSDNMQIEIPKSSLPGVLVDDLHLVDTTCGAEQNKTHFTLQTAFDKCGTKTDKTASTISFSNDVDFLRSAAHHDVITRVDDEFAVVFKCTYSREKKLISSAMHPQKTKVLSEKHSDGKLSFSLKMFPNDIFDTAYTVFPVSLKLRQPIYLQVSVKSADESLTILAKDCYATPSKVTGVLVYKLIEDGCPVDSTLKNLDAPTNNVQRFSLQMFAFLGNHKDMYFHCDVIACDAKDTGSRCARGCASPSKRRARREVEGKSTPLVEGPFILAMPKQPKKNRAGKKSHSFSEEG